MVSAIASKRSVSESVSENSLKVPSSTSPASDLDDQQWEYEQNQRREKQRARMVRWRLGRKQDLAKLSQQRQVLEDMLQCHIEAAQRANKLSSNDGLESRYHVLRQLVIKRAALARENAVLQKALEPYEDFEDAIRQLQCVHGVESSSPLSVLKGSSELGWRVHFSDGSPSFHFHPYSSEEFNDIVNQEEGLYSLQNPCIVHVGDILGWSVDYAPVALDATNTFYMAHARFTRHLRCSLDFSELQLTTVDPKFLPVLTTPRCWEHVQSERMNCQALQRFGNNAYALVCSIPGDVHLRYIALARHTRSTQPNGFRADKYTVLIADSETNAWHRLAEGMRQDVQWVLEGGASVTLTEVDATTVNVEYTQWGACLSEMHGRELYIDWIRFAVHLEQLISPSRLLKL